MPKSRGFCWVKNRVAASNMVKNILRAARQGKCDRAERIHDSREYRWVLQCTSVRTLERVNRKIERCWERTAA